jgi:hypothetical protein
LVPLGIVLLFLAVKRFPGLGPAPGIGVKDFPKEDTHTIDSDDGSVLVLLYNSTKHYDFGGALPRRAI